MKDVRSTPPKQAVILAGGRGTRLAPITDTLPKPMIRFHNKPFLEYLIEMLRENGFERILLLLGYLPEVIRSYFGDGKRWGLSIEYFVSDVEDETGRRIKLAKPFIDPYFLLMYCDNYWPMQFRLMWDHFVSRGILAQATVYSNPDGYTRDNVRLDSEGFIEVYDKSRAGANLSGVDIGFAILDRDVIDMLPDENVSFEKEIYPKLAIRRQIKAFLTEHRYYSVGSFERMHLTEDFLARRPTILLDRDGVLNKKMPKAQYVCSWSEWEWLSGARKALRLFKEAGYTTIIISNQPGIARGAFTESTLNEIHDRMQADAKEAYGNIDAIYYCSHDWNDGCNCRKPKPGLLYRAQRDYNFDLSRTYFVGDDERDGQAAEAAGCRFMLVSEDIALIDVARILINENL